MHYKEMAIVGVATACLATPGWSSSDWPLRVLPPRGGGSLMCGTWGYRASPAVSGQGQCLQPSVFSPSLATRLTTIWGQSGLGAGSSGRQGQDPQHWWPCISSPVHLSTGHRGRGGICKPPRSWLSCLQALVIGTQASSIEGTKCRWLVLPSFLSVASLLSYQLQAW